MTLPPSATQPPGRPAESPPPPASGVNWLPLIAVVTAVVLLSVVGVVISQGEPARSTEPLSAPGEPYGDTVERATDDLNLFWAEKLPETYGVEYAELRHGVIRYSEENDPPDCGPEVLTYQDMANNAFYCPPQLVPEDTQQVASGDYIAYDSQSLFPSIAERFGGAGVAAILAHEWGHAVQNRGQVAADDTIELELQADCFAGAWLKWVRDDASPYLTASVDDLDRAAAALLTFRDPPGADPTSETAHGNGFDRVAAFQDGFVNGTSACADYPQGGVTFTEDVYRSYFDLLSEGNAPLESLPPLVFQGLEDFWPDRFGEAFDTTEEYSPVETLEEFTDAPPQCQGGAVPEPQEVQTAAFYCPGSDTLGWTVGGPMSELYDVFGDGSVAEVLIDRWGYAMRHKAGEDLDGVEAALQVDCTTGAFFRYANASGALSPGDLDEAIANLLASSLLLDFSDERGTGFVRVGAFRVGFDDGIAACSSVTPPDAS